VTLLGVAVFDLLEAVLDLVAGERGSEALEKVA
jgi:hypothetical protein